MNSRRRRHRRRGGRERARVNETHRRAEAPQTIVSSSHLSTSAVKTVLPPGAVGVTNA